MVIFWNEKPGAILIGELLPHCSCSFPHPAPSPKLDSSDPIRGEILRRGALLWRKPLNQGMCTARHLRRCARQLLPQDAPRPCTVFKITVSIQDPYLQLLHNHLLYFSTSGCHFSGKVNLRTKTPFSVSSSKSSMRPTPASELKNSTEGREKSTSESSTLFQERPKWKKTWEWNLFTFWMIVSLMSKFPRWSTATKSPIPKLNAGLSVVWQKIWKPHHKNQV